MIGLDQVQEKMIYIRKCVEIMLEILWHDATYHEAGPYLKWQRLANFGIFWFPPAEGAVILWMSCCIIL